MANLSPELATFRRWSKIFSILMIPGILMLLWNSFLADLATTSNLMIGYALLAPGFLGLMYLLIFKRDLAAQNRKYSKLLVQQMNPKERAKKYTRNLYILLVLGFAFVFWGFSVGDMVLPFVGIACLVFFLFGVIATRVADLALEKGRSWVAFFWLSLLLSPLLTWLILASVKGEKIQTEQSQTTSISEEIGKLEALYKSGALSEEEFKRAKSKLLET